MFARAPKRARRLTPRRLAAAAVATASVAALSACHPGSAASGSSSGGGASDFKGKTITLIAPDKPGGSYDTYARLFAPYVAKNLGATINIENIPGGGTLQGSNRMAASPADGTTIGMVNVGGDVASQVEKNPGQSFDLKKISWIGQPAQVPNAVVTQPGSKVTSFDSLLHAKSAVHVLDIRNGVGDMLNRVVYGAFGIPHSLDTGFEHTSDLKQGFIAKDGQTIQEAMSTLYPLIAGHEAKPLLVVGTPGASYAKVLAGVPTLQSELTKAKLSSSQSAAVKEALALGSLADDFAAPPGLPAKDLTVLRQAFAKAAADPALRKAAAKQSLPVSWTDGATTRRQVSQALSASSAIAPYVSK